MNYGDYLGNHNAMPFTVNLQLFKNIQNGLKARLGASIPPQH